MRSFHKYDWDSEPIVASVRHPLHVIAVAKLGAGIFTIPFDVLKKMVQHSLTDVRLKRFLVDSQKVPKQDASRRAPVPDIYGRLTEARRHTPPMRGAVLLVLALASILISPGFLEVAPPEARATTGYPRVIMTATPEIAAANGTIVFDIYTYQGSQLVEPLGTPCVSRRPPPILGAQCLSAARVGLGHYRANLSLHTYNPESAVAEAVDSYMFAIANVSGRVVYSMTPFYWVFEGAWLRAYANRSMARPGDSLRITIEAFNGSKRVDAGSVSVRLTSSNFSSNHDYAAVRTAVGVYEADVQVPQYDPLGGWVSITARALYRTYPIERPVVLAQADGVQVWYHETSVDATASRGDLWVADGFGRPIAHAPVNLTMNNGQQTFLNLTADDAGRVPLTLPFGSEHLISVDLKVGPSYPTYGWNRVTLFPQGIPYRHTLAADPSLMPDGKARDYLRPNETVVRHFRTVEYDAENVPVPQPNQEVEYFAWMPEGAVVSGQTQSDAEGLFSISIPVSWKGFNLEISWGTNNADTFLYQVASPLVAMTVSPLTLGGATTVNVSAAGQIGRIAQVNGARADVEMLSSTNQSWMRWAPSYYVSGSELAPSHEAVTGDLYLPSFLPQDAKYAIRSGIALGVGQVAVLGVGERLDIPAEVTPPTSDAGLWVGLGVLGAAGAVAVAAILLYRRRRGASPLQP